MHAHWRALLDHRSTKVVRIGPVDVLLGFCVRALAWLVGVGLVVSLLPGTGIDPNAVWLQGAGLPQAVVTALLAAFFVAVALGPLLGGRGMRAVGVYAAVLLAAVALADTAVFYRALNAGTSQPRLPIPVAAPVALLLIAWAIRARQRGAGGDPTRPRDPWQKLMERALP